MSAPTYDPQSPAHRGTDEGVSRLMQNSHDGRGEVERRRRTSAAGHDEHSKHADEGEAHHQWSERSGAPELLRPRLIDLVSGAHPRTVRASPAAPTGTSAVVYS